MNLNDAFPSKYLKAGDLPEEGSQTVTIEKIGLEEVGRDKQTKPVIYFEELDRGLVCNKTNARTIARALGSEDFDDWIGRKIALYRADVDFQGEMVEAIRVRLPKAPAPLRKASTVPSDDEDEDIPF